MNDLNYKESSYNFEFPYEDDESKRILYNSRTNALALIDKEKYTCFQNFKERGQPISDEKLLEDLKHGGYILRDDIDELELIRFNLLQSRYNTSSLGLTIAPTSDCNFRCIYCYEKESLKPVVMSGGVQEKVVELVKARAESIMRLSVTWYGGEPLLALDIIENLTNKFLEICEENKIRYDAGIVTNGYLLTTKVAERLKDLRITHTQITVDGAPEEHDKRRPLAGGQPTFHKIISNLRAAKEILPCKVSIRINTDKDNADQVDEVLKILKENDLNDVAYPYLGMVENSNDCYAESSCYHPEEFSAVEFDYRIRNSSDISNSYPRLIANSCGADSNSNLVINADGKLYKCWNDIGVKERTVGDLLAPASDAAMVPLLQYLMYDPTHDSECSKCKYLPICMGGCPSRRLFRKDTRCNVMRYRLKDYICVISFYLKNNKIKPANKDDDMA